MAETFPNDADRRLLAEARTLAGRALAPLAARRGAVAVTRDGAHHPGVTIQLAGAVGLSACAEQVALSAARAAGGEVTALYIWEPHGAGDHPCGRCLQIWRELAPEATALLQRGDDAPVALDLAQLLPDPFTHY